MKEVVLNYRPDPGLWIYGDLSSRDLDYLMKRTGLSKKAQRDECGNYIVERMSGSGELWAVKFLAR